MKENEQLGASTMRIKIIQVRSSIGHRKSQKATLKALGLGRIGRVRELPANDAVLGMIKTVAHLVEVRPE